MVDNLIDSRSACDIMRLSAIMVLRELDNASSGIDGGNNWFRFVYRFSVCQTESYFYHNMHAFVVCDCL
jgi:hypothetical protein